MLCSNKRHPRQSIHEVHVGSNPRQHVPALHQPTRTHHPSLGHPRYASGSQSESAQGTSNKSPSGTLTHARAGNPTHDILNQASNGPSKQLAHQ